MEELKDIDLVEKITKNHKDAKDHIGDWRTEAREDYNFVAGHQWDDNDITKLSDENRPIITFNRINPMVGAILGIEANQRQEIKFLGREVHDSGLSEAIHEIGKWCRDYADIEYEEAQSFEDMITTGMGWSESRMEYDTDLDGKFIQERADPFEFTWDIRAKKRNLSDARWMCREKKLSKDEILELWPDAELDLVTDSDGTDPFAPNLTVVDPENRYESESVNLQSKDKSISVLHYQYYKTEPVYRAQHPMTGEIIELSAEQFKETKKFLESNNVEYIKQNKRSYYEVFICGKTILEDKKSKCQSGFTFKCITGKRDHIKNQWYGLVRLMKDPQKWSNKFFSEILDILSANSKGGIIVEEGVFTDIRKAEEAWAKSNSIIYTKPGTLQNNRLIPKPQTPYPQGIDRLLQFAISAIREVSGVNLELMGLAEREQAGVVEETRKRSAYAILAIYFDSFKSYRKSCGLTMLEFIKSYIPAKRMERILSDEYKQYVPAIKNIDLQKVDIIVSEVPQSENMKMITWSFITSIMPVLIKNGIPFPPEVFEYSPLPTPLSEKWKQMLAPTPEAKTNKQLDMKQKAMDAAKTEAEVEKAKVEMIKIQADAELAHAKAQNENPAIAEQEHQMNMQGKVMDMQAKSVDHAQKTEMMNLKLRNEMMKPKQTPKGE